MTHNLSEEEVTQRYEALSAIANRAGSHFILGNSQPGASQALYSELLEVAKNPDIPDVEFPQRVSSILSSIRADQYGYNG